MTYFFKAEANSKIGGGHLHRSISIAKELVKQGFKVCFIFADSNEKSIEKIKHLNWDFKIISKKQELDSACYLAFMPSDSFVLFDTDDPNFYSGNLIDQLRKGGITTACYTITDQYPISTDVLINTNVVSKTHSYQTPNYTHKIVGSEYLIFTEGFRNSPIHERQIESTDNILLFFGNADFHNLTYQVIDALRDSHLKVKHVHVLVGGLNPNYKSIQDLCKQVDLSITLHHNISDMMALYEQVDLAITAAGMTMWEMAMYKIPQMVIASSERENTYTKYLANQKYIHLLGSYNDKESLTNVDGKINELIQNKPHNCLNLQGFKNLLDPNGILKLTNEIIHIANKSISQ